MPTEVISSSRFPSRYQALSEEKASVGFSFFLATFTQEMNVSFGKIKHFRMFQPSVCSSVDYPLADCCPCYLNQLFSSVVKLGEGGGETPTLLS